MKVSRAAFHTTFALAAIAAIAVGCASPAPRRTVTVPAEPTVVTPVPPAGTTVVTPPIPSTTVLTPVPGGTVMTPVSTADAASLLDLAQHSVAEMRLAQLAQTRSTSEPIRQLAQRLTADHHRAISQLSPLAQQRGVVVPQASDATHQAIEQRLAALSGAQFDVAFLEQIIGDHARATAMLERLAAMAVDPSVRAFATAQLPLIRDHQAQAMGLHAQLRTPVGVVGGGGVQPSASPIIIVPGR